MTKSEQEKFKCSENIENRRNIQGGYYNQSTSILMSRLLTIESCCIQTTFQNSSFNAKIYVKQNALSPSILSKLLHFEPAKTGVLEDEFGSDQLSEGSANI